MRQTRLRIRQRPRSVAVVLVAALGPAAVLVPAIIASARNAAAAPAAGYTASYIRAGTGTPESVAVDTATDTVYLGNSADQLIAIDGASHAIVATVSLAGAPRGIAVDAATNTVYVSVSASTPEVAVINGATNSVSTTIPLPTGTNPAGIAVDRTTDTVYVADQISAGGVVVIDGVSNTVTTTVSSGGGNAYAIAVDESTNVVWVANTSGAVVALDATSGAVTHSVSVAGAPESVAVNGVTDTVYVASEAGGGGLTVIAGATGVVTTTVAVGATNAVAVDPAADVVFVRGVEPGTTVGGTVVIDGTTNAVVNVIGRLGNFAAVDSATGALYVTASNYYPGLFAITPSASNAMSPLITGLSPSAATFTVGTAGSVKFLATALPPATFTETGQLPSGVTLSSSGTLGGTPAAGTGGVFPLTITASNGVAPDYSLALTLTIHEAPTLTVPVAATVQVGLPVSIPFQVTGYPAPYQVVNDTALPAGIGTTRSASGTWELSGTPAPGSGGVYQAEFQAINVAGVSGVAVMSLTVQEAPSITSAATATFGSDASNAYGITAHCAPSCTFSGTGLPSGLKLSSSGVLSGDPKAGTYNLTITASNSLGTTTQAFTLIVKQSIAVGVEEGQLLAEAPQLSLGLGWVSLGGLIVAAPAVVAVPTPGGSTPVAPLFIATGSNGELWMWSVTAGWQPLGPSEAFCIGGPAAVVTGTTLTVACEGLNRQLYYNTATLPSSGLPAFSGPWTSLGGILSAGPAVAPVGRTMTFFAEGTNGQVFTRTTTAGYAATPWFCIGHLAAATDAFTGITTFGCQGGDHSLWTATNTGTGWSNAHSLGGVLIDGPGIAAASGTTEFVVEGTDGTVWQWTSGGGWASLLGSASGGVGAVALN